jgi:serine/threonine protein kinase
VIHNMNFGLRTKIKDDINNWAYHVDFLLWSILYSFPTYLFLFIYAMQWTKSEPDRRWDQYIFFTQNSRWYSIFYWNWQPPAFYWYQERISLDRGHYFQYLDQSGAFCSCNSLSFTLICYIVNLLTYLSLYWFSQDFRHEVNLLVKLRHPNIVQFLGAVTDRKPLMLITEYLRGV